MCVREKEIVCLYEFILNVIRLLLENVRSDFINGVVHAFVCMCAGDRRRISSVKSGFIHCVL